MKKFAKCSLITALSMLFIGILILVICTIIGGASLFGYLKNKLVHHEFLSSIFDDALVSFHNGEDTIDFSDHHLTHSGKHENMQVALASDILKLNIDLGGGTCIISESSDEYFHIYTENAQKFQYFTEDQTLYLKGFDDISFRIPFLDSYQVFLEIPKNFSFENIKIELGAGCIETNFLSAINTIDIEVAAGEFVADSLSADTLKIELGAGNVEIENASVNDSDVVIGLGNMTYYGTITKDLTAKCGMGNLELFLNDQAENHNYDIDCSMGNMTVGRESYNGLAHTRNVNNGANSTYTLECGMGNMTVLFQ